MSKILNFPKFKGVSFVGHADRNDFAFAKFHSGSLPRVLDVAKHLGWDVKTKGVRAEYEGCHVIIAPSEGYIDAIPGYRDEQPRIDYMILRRSKDTIYVTFSSWEKVTPFTVKNFNLFIKFVKSKTLIYNSQLK